MCVANSCSHQTHLDSASQTLTCCNIYDSFSRLSTSHTHRSHQLAPLIPSILHKSFSRCEPPLPVSLGSRHPPGRGLGSSPSETSSATSRLSASIPVLTQVIRFTPDPMTPPRLNDQLDLYNFSQDSLVQPAVQRAAQVMTSNVFHDTPHMTLVSPAAGKHNDDMKDRVKRRDQKLRRLMFGDSSTLLRQRSLVIKELMVGHGHQGCLMTTKPVQNELRKLLNKTMRLKSKDRRRAPSIEKLRRWVKKKRSRSENLVSILDSGTTRGDWRRIGTDSLGDISRQGSPQQSGASSGSYLTPIPVTPSRHNQRQTRHPTSLRRSHSERSNQERHGRPEQILQDNSPNHGSVRHSRRARSFRERSRDYATQSTSDRISDLSETEGFAQNTSRKCKRNQFSLRRRENADYSSHKPNAVSAYYREHMLARRHSKRQRQVSPPEGSCCSSWSRAPSSSPPRTFQTESSRPSHYGGSASPRPRSRLQRLRQVWQEDDIYALNPFDSWRLRHLPTHTCPPTPHPQRQRKNQGDVGLGALLPNRAPIRQQIRNSWRMKRYTPSPSSTHQYDYGDTDSPPPSPTQGLSHLLPHPTDIIFRKHPNESPYPNPQLSGPLNPFHLEASPLVLGWLQVPSNANDPTKSMMFRKAPWLNHLQFLGK